MSKTPEQRWADEMAALQARHKAKLREIDRQYRLMLCLIAAIALASAAPVVVLIVRSAL